MFQESTNLVNFRIIVFTNVLIGYTLYKSNENFNPLKPRYLKKIVNGIYWVSDLNGVER